MSNQAQAIRLRAFRRRLEKASEPSVQPRHLPTEGDGQPRARERVTGRDGPKKQRRVAL